MSITRKALAAMGLEAEKIDLIINMHTETTDSMKEQIEVLEKEGKKYKADAEKLKDAQKELDDLKATVAAEAKEREGKDYDKLKEEFDAYKAEAEKKEARVGKETAFKEILKDAGIDEKYYSKVIKYSDVDGIELDDKGKVKAAKDLIKSVKEEWPELIAATSVAGASTPQPPQNTGGSGKTKEEILAIKDYAEMQQAIADNHELFGF